MKYTFQAEIVNRILSVAARRQWSTGNLVQGGTDATNVCVLDPFATWEVHKNELLSSLIALPRTRLGRQGMPLGGEGDGAMLGKVT